MGGWKNLFKCAGRYTLNNLYHRSLYQAFSENETKRTWFGVCVIIKNRTCFIYLIETSTIFNRYTQKTPGRVAQSVTCLATDTCLRVWLQIRVWLHIQGSRVRSRSGPILSWRLIMKWFLRSFSSLPLIHSRRVVVSYKRKYVHELLVNRLFKPAQENVCLGKLTFPQWP